MRYDYYAHRSKGVVSDYFGHIGPPKKVSMLRYYWMKPQKFRVTKVPAGSSLREVMKQALTNSEANIDSMHVKETLEQYTY